MANFTRKAIKETFIALLEERPLSDITIKDIVETCGINRNSFYYHFQDLPALIEEIVKEEDIQFLSESAAADACAPGNPKDAGLKDIIAIYKSLL